jgi:hypothetical protein
MYLSKAQAQTIPFEAQPGSHVQAEVFANLANEVWIYFQNTSPDSLRLLWRRIEVSKPAEWDIDLCDYGACVGGVPASGLMLPIGQYDSAYLKLIVQPKDVLGQAELRFRVADNSNQSLYRDCTFTLRSPGVSSTELNSLQPEFKIFPNPVTDQLNVQLSGEVGQLDLLDSQGSVLETRFIDQTLNQDVLDMRLRQIGLYYLRFTSIFGAWLRPVVKI